MEETLRGFCGFLKDLVMAVDFLYVLARMGPDFPFLYFLRRHSCRGLEDALLRVLETAGGAWRENVDVIAFLVIPYTFAEPSCRRRDSEEAACDVVRVKWLELLLLTLGGLL